MRTLYPDEPMFVLLGRDPAAVAAILTWIRVRKEIKPVDAIELMMHEEAHECAMAMLWEVMSEGTADNRCLCKNNGRIPGMYRVKFLLNRTAEDGPIPSLPLAPAPRGPGDTGHFA